MYVELIIIFSNIIILIFNVYWKILDKDINFCMGYKFMFYFKNFIILNLNICVNIK